MSEGSPAKLQECPCPATISTVHSGAKGKLSAGKKIIFEDSWALRFHSLFMQVPVKIPTQNCQQIPRESCQKIPRQNCQKVPTQNCSEVPVKTPTKIAKQVCDRQRSGYGYH